MPHVGRLSSGRQTMSAKVSPSTEITIVPVGLLHERVWELLLYYGKDGVTLQ